MLVFVTHFEAIRIIQCGGNKGKILPSRIVLTFDCLFNPATRNKGTNCDVIGVVVVVRYVAAAVVVYCVQHFLTSITLSKPTVNDNVG